VNGHIYVVRIGEELFVKMVSKENGEWKLLSINPAYAPISMDGESEVVGEALGIAVF
jgi:SOS-response transcriptional repressor LexA